MDFPQWTHQLYTQLRRCMVLQVMALNESPVFLLLDPAPRPAGKELPLKLYESGAPLTPVGPYPSAETVSA